MCEYLLDEDNLSEFNSFQLTEIKENIKKILKEIDYVVTKNSLNF
jgi:hypothetical protein